MNLIVLSVSSSVEIVVAVSLLSTFACHYSSEFLKRSVRLGSVNFGLSSPCVWQFAAFQPKTHLCLATVIGSMLSKIRELRSLLCSTVPINLYPQVLVLGLCFFAGGMKFSEQGFDPSKSSLTS